MKNSMDQSIIVKALMWFSIYKREEPWRDNPTPYRVWISEMMLQQTTVATVKKYFLRFMERFPKLDDLANASEDDVLHLWAGLGYYSRARNILKTAKIIKKEENFPQDRHELRSLPGIGPYTSAAITSIAYNKPDALVDTNVDRVLGRFFGMMRTEPSFNKKIESIAQEIMDVVAEIRPSDIWIWNQVLMEIGALICQVSRAKCMECPLSTQCKAFLLEKSLVFPGIKPKADIIAIEESCVIIKKESLIVLCKNNVGRRKGLYDFKLINNKQGLELLGQISYRISNNKVTRNVFLLKNDLHHLQEDEVFVDPIDCQKYYPITSSCKKVIQKYILPKNK
ncbi:MAG: A/G-specific adenine glycosylase [Brevinema sp.]